MKKIMFAIAVLCSLPALADEASKRAKINTLVEAQGLKQMFDEQLNQTRISMASVGKSMFTEMTKENGVTAAESDPRFARIYASYIERVGSILTSRELIDLWSAQYGKQLSEAELDQVIAYYQSPVGKKDVRAARVAMVGFTQQTLALTEKRASVLTAQMVKELDAALKKK